MTRRGKKFLLKPLVLVIAGLSLGGCISPQADSVTGRYTAPIGGSPVISNETPYSAALRCMAGYTNQHPLRIAVGQIADYTGKSESDNSGRKITQGAALMAMSALSKAGVQLVERFDTSVAEMELKYANNKLIGADQNGGPDYRQIIAGSIPGSDYYLVGGITELNFNIRSVGANADGGETATNGLKGSTGGNMYVMNVGLDLRLVDTKTLQVVDVISYQKQIIGRQVSVGVFDFLGANFFDASVGESALEPIQLAVRSVIERAVLEMTARLYHTNGSCAAVTDPLADGSDRPAAPEYRANTPVTARNEEHANDPSRQDPYRYYGSSDPAADGLRGSE
ncbi:MAG TPA: holdfast anchoring protein HfaB [Rhizomicrobium sp.]|nr:holdfast anchoring protein HfaB [Rhizomicrobium sp.]